MGVFFITTSFPFHSQSSATHYIPVFSLFSFLYLIGSAFFRLQTGAAIFLCSHCVD